MKIEKKIWPEYFEAVKSGKKKFELRMADFEANPGDVLVLKEWDPAKKAYTGRQIEKKVASVFKLSGTNIFKMYKKEDVEKYGFHIIEIV